MALVIAFNNTISTTGTTQALDPSGVEPLSYAQSLTVYALKGNAATIFIANKPAAGAGVGYPLEAGQSVTILKPDTGLFVTGTATDGYGVIGS
jgi:hypothetical protein